ncbi:Protein FAR1-RELATED SEQUENCE 3 [Panicum miliaceum]|uniref:Protein FAR1-RELATED SEQUENCE 3 n=1 Tax=Panicum miliaceum TaxID=4540 RepID=A0A3L6RZY8_PANMI|nr:Protein FAR1-RELATED SEQUENCE 3 [Panicum miliaceum]
MAIATEAPAVVERSADLNQARPMDGSPGFGGAYRDAVFDGKVIDLNKDALAELSKTYSVLRVPRLQGHQVGRRIKYNIPIEAHAVSIYTRNMHEKFCELIFDSGNFVAFEIIPHMKYRTVHIRADRRERWEKVEFDIDVISNGEEYICECGLAENMGMICPHIIRVLIQFGIQEIPRKHIIKRWTINARDILPAHLEHYQKEKAALHSQTLRHSGLYLTALEVVNLGDSNVKAYEIAMEHLLQAKTELQELSAEKDGFSLPDQLCVQQQVLHATEEGHLNFETMNPIQDESNMLNVLPPERMKKRGRPSNACDKPPYEQGRKRNKHYLPHQAPVQTSGDMNQPMDQANPKRKITKCSRCHLPGHNRNACRAPAPPEFVMSS